MKSRREEDPEFVWGKCLQIIKDNVDSDNYKEWFLPIIPLNVDKKTLQIIIPNNFFYEWLEEHFIELLKRTIQHVIGKDAKLKCVVVTEKVVSFSLDEHIRKNTIIAISSQVNEKMISYFSKNPHEMKTMNRRLFEEFIAEIFNGFGFEIELTKRTRDGGRDIVAIKNTEVKLKYLIECKRPDPGNLVSVKPVRELLGVKVDERATKAILATTSYFTPDAHLLSERNKWELELKDFDGIMQWIEKYKEAKQIF